MKHNTHVKYNTLESFVSTINDLGIELIIDESLRNVRKHELEHLIDDALKIKTRMISNAIQMNTKTWRNFSLDNLIDYLK